MGSTSRVLAALAVAFPIFAPAQQQHAGHDIYKDLNTDGSYREYGKLGSPCCGGDPVWGDCEPVGSDYRLLPTGDVIFVIHRYGKAEVLIAKERILWITIKGGEFSQAHWCGTPRTKVAGNRDVEPVEPLDPDPDFVTKCATIAPGGF